MRTTRGGVGEGERGATDSARGEIRTTTTKRKKRDTQPPLPRLPSLSPLLQDSSTGKEAALGPCLPPEASSRLPPPPTLSSQSCALAENSNSNKSNNSNNSNNNRRKRTTTSLFRAVEARKTLPQPPAVWGRCCRSTETNGACE